MFDAAVAALDRPLKPRFIVRGSILLIALYAALMVWAAVSLKDGLMPTGDPAGQDFSNFYAAGELTAAGRPADVYPLDTFQAQLERDHKGLLALYVWNYPPPTQMLMAALPTLPYLAALTVWTILSLASLALAARILSGHRLAWLITLAAPAAFWDTWHHQVGSISAVLLALGFFYSSSRPLRGGALIGAMIIKPHLAVAAPFVLMAGKRWTAIAAAAASSLGLCAISYLVLGPEVWRAFLLYAPRGRAMLEGGGQLQSLMPSIFVFLRMTGAPLSFAYLVHAAAAVASVGAAVVVWRGSADPRLRTAAALAACSLISPYTFAYDATLTGLGIAAVAGLAQQRTLPRGAIGVLTLAWFWPLPAAALAFLYHLQLGWAAPVALLALTVADSASLRRSPNKTAAGAEIIGHAAE